MRFEFHPEALAEYEAAAHYYAEQQPGLELRFITCVEQAIQLIVDAPLRWPPVEEDVRRCIARVFPYGILYAVEPDFVLILAIAHCSREPDFWKNRLS